MKIRYFLGAIVVVTAVSTACGGSDGGTTTPTVTTTAYISQLNGNNEVPARATPATGTANYTLTGNILSWVITVNGLTTPATQGHIHGPAVAGVNASVIVPFVTNAITSGTVTSGSVDLSLPIGTTGVSGDSLLKLLNSGQLYTNIHTSTYTGGEIRGQIVKQ